MMATLDITLALSGKEEKGVRGFCKMNPASLKAIPAPGANEVLDGL